MRRLVYGALAGGIFGAGLVVSGMVNTVKVQGWLDVFGDWDPTLAFVMGGAILPMAVAWRVAARRQASVLGFALPPPPRREVGPDLVIGSTLFGMGWALAGLCPGPAIAQIGFGGWGGLLFLLAMAGGMVAAPALRARLTAPRSQLDIRALTPTYAVSPQITPEDLPAIKAAGFTTVINNRPEQEIPPELGNDVMEAAARALGLAFVANYLSPGNITPANIAVQRDAVAASAGPTFAYCQSGNRSSQVWALMNAGSRPTDELIGIPARFGYRLEPLRARIDSLAGK